MRLLRFDLEKYGAFENASLAFRPDARLHVVYGANEAGKSSALAALSDLLFGFGERTDYAFRHAMTDLRLGARLRARDGAEFAFRRRKGRRATLIGPDDEPLDDALLAPFVGGLTREVFTRAFGLDAEGLRAGAEELLAAEGESGASLFAAASGLRGVEDERRRLEAEADALFSPQARTRPFNELSKRHDAARKALGEAELGATAWRRLNDEIGALQDRLDGLDALRGKARTERGRLERLVRAHGAALQAERAALALEAFGTAPELAPGALDVLRARLDAAEAAAAADGRAAEALGAAEAELARLVVDDAFVASGEAIEDLVALSGAYAKGQQDLPRLEREADAAEEALARLAVRLGLSGAAAIEPAMPTDAARAELRDLIRKSERSTQAREAAERLLAGEQERRAKLRARLGDDPPPDPRLLREALGAFAKPLAALARREELLAERDREARATAEAALRLSPPVADLDRAATRSLPGVEAIAAARREADALAVERARLDDAAARDSEEAARVAEELKRLAGGAEVASPETIFAARAAREAAWRPLRDHLVGSADLPAERRLTGVAGFEREAAEADRLADRLGEDAARAARIADLRARSDALAASLETLAARRDDVRKRSAAFGDGWTAAWAKIGVAPSAPAEMEAWRKDFAALLERRERNAERAAALARLDAEEAALRPRLQALAAEAGIDRAGTIDARELAERLDARLGALADRFQEASAVKSQLADAEARIGDAERALAALDAEAEAARARWAKAAPAVGLAGDASPVVVSAALDAWAEAPALVGQRAGLSQRIRGLRRDADAFCAGVGRLVADFAGELAGLPPETAARRLSERLAAEQQTAALKRDAERRRAEAAAAAERAALANGEAAAALAAAASGLPQEDDLRALLARIAERERLSGALDAARKNLLERGETADEAGLRAELENFDRDAAPAEIERFEAEERRLELEAQQVFAELAAARARREGLGGAKAEEASAEQRAAGAAMYAMAREWSVRKLASLMLSAAVERARAGDRSPVLDRAAALFSTLTGGAFAGFSEVYEAETPTLLGKRASGETVPIRGMSEGARDQFYLALRLAVLEDFSARAEPAPFIGDDVLASFDEARTAHALKALAEIGDRVQPILFTHHRTVADIAAATLGEAADVIELGRV